MIAALKIAGSSETIGSSLGTLCCLDATDLVLVWKCARVERVDNFRD
jgi:hypothetical protein